MVTGFSSNDRNGSSTDSSYIHATHLLATSVESRHSEASLVLTAGHQAAR
jgi:hypothetical protein